MPRPSIYNHENVQRLRYAQIGATVLAVAICGYLSITTLLSMREIWGADQLLREGKTEAASLSREATGQQRAESRLPPPGCGGVDSFAVQLARWAEVRRVKVESFVPEGAASPTEVSFDGSKLGTWSASKVRVKGQGDYSQIMSLLDELRAPKLPVQLEAFTLQSAQAGGRTSVSFDLLLTVYEKTRGTG